MLRQLAQNQMAADAAVDQAKATATQAKIASLVGSFPQNLLTNVKRGDKVEMVFKTYPGQVFPGTVDKIIPATGEGQMMVLGNLPSAAQVGSRGMLAVKFDLQDQQLASQPKMGTAGVAVIYTNAGKLLHIISRVTIWIHAWRYYILPI